MGRGCLLYKIELRKAFRQIKICPGDYNLVSFIWKKHTFCDTVLSMGTKSSAHCCQRVTNAISFIMFQIGFCLLNYLDDLATTEKAVFPLPLSEQSLQNVASKRHKIKHVLLIQ